ncbi:oxygenase MpaB family protein [Oscillatoria sp. CS-180]|uniref:oxygenase MpaB family protein n=1 Tax=Oscillatoria sp. CS-180 TaxID=3021720 RepID=UPI00232BDE13|nr:oxygenase MpaB family protein [Oscillatoria sp. CS-180]MDB9526810.1 oxygenase MpaB family protein [Oscillatoria sp. CS-180]
MNTPHISPTAGLQQAPDDSAAICRRLAGFDFPWELNRALEIAILKTFCVPRISHLLHQTGEFERRPQKRYDDTSLILGNIVKWGYDSPRGRAAIARMNRIHQRFDIDNEDFLYVLSTFIYEPIRWNQLFGWRPFTPEEENALFQFWRAVGHRMNIQGIPDTSAAYEQFNQRYEAEHFKYHADNAAIGEAVVALMKGWLPSAAAPVVPVVVKAVASDSMRRAMGWSKPSPLVSQAIFQGLKLRQKLTQQLPEREESNFIVDTPNTTYPDGYQLEKLGPDAPTVQTTSSSKCPFMRMRAFLKADA